jgi:hypothetical protein
MDMSTSAPRESPEVLTAARTSIDAIIGEDSFADLVEDIAVDRLKTAVARLQSTSWWQKTLSDAILNPGMFNTALLCKLLDKAVPTQQAVKVGAEEGFRLVIEQTAVPLRDEPEGDPLDG